jgi:transposase
MTEKRARRTYSEEQKKQLVELFNWGKPRGEIIREYDLTGSAFDKWVKRINTTGSSREKDNRTVCRRTGTDTASKGKSATAHGE